MSIEFEAVLRDKGTTKGTKKILLEVSARDLKGHVEDLQNMFDHDITVIIHPGTYVYEAEVEKESGKHAVKYWTNPDGTVEVIREEQTALDLGDGEKNTVVKQIPVDKSVVDTYIKTATSLQYPETLLINPRDVLIRLDNGETADKIAADYEMSSYTLLNNLENARQHFAPFADTWNKNSSEMNIDGSSSDDIDREDDADSDEKVVDSDESATKTENPGTEKSDSDENTKETETSSDDTDGEVDPY
ncbi:hypothetical protein [Enterococcus pallens]|uniref:Uncharacterized protein n=1 Tax=Enterococcus pallens ATCC BAA-351 TaxID=1158607 RepID=R2QHY6_9ENTE|nr:hypothetical protein [Enterococcus pallens]EOH94803.1 hypothetical protein UAU_01725 [Enterococcus pallens ATCC BAA-351]EOU14878.1 hypothetical protein I588_04528 [Enterococcus pallens ATCC BAA-351]OJG78139.1 hypothetical protein RV10_GL001627 [Enterococcus pallens]